MTATATATEEKKTFGQRVAGWLVMVLIAAVGLMALAALIGIAGDGAKSTIGAIGLAGHNIGLEARNAQLGVMEMLNAFLQIGFQVLLVVALGGFLVFLAKKIKAALDDGHGGHGAHPPAAPAAAAPRPPAATPAAPHP